METDTQTYEEWRNRKEGKEECEQYPPTGFIEGRPPEPRELPDKYREG